MQSLPCTPETYEETLSELQLLTLVVWREARGESLDAKRAVAHAIKNRVQHPSWWGRDWRTVIMKPWQFSSMPIFQDGKNINPDPNCEKWPDDDSPSETDSLSVASGAYLDLDDDPTDGANHYHDTSMSWPKAWGPFTGYVNTVNIGRLKFYRLLPANQAHTSDVTDIK
jgi:hypothetical protein